MTSLLEQAEQVLEKHNPGLIRAGIRAITSPLAQAG